MKVKEMCYEVCGTICVSRCSFCWSLSVWILISAPLPQLWLPNSSSHCTQQQQSLYPTAAVTVPNKQQQSLYTTAAVTVPNSSSHCTQQQQSLYPTAAVTVPNSSSHCTQQQQSLYPTAAVTVHNSSSHCTQQQQSLYTTAAVTVHNSSRHRRFSKAGLLEWMRFVIFHERSRERSQCTSGPISE